MPKGGWIITFTGLHVYPFDFRPEMIDLEDIVHALSNLCRFTGHSRRFYSVAEHSVLISQALFEKTDSPIIALQGLLHDAEEAYLNDLSAPVKHMDCMVQYRAAGAEIERVILEYFGLPRVLDPTVKAADLGMLRTEGKFFFYDIDEWAPEIVKAKPIEVHPYCWTPPMARGEFMKQFNRLAAVLKTQGYELPEIRYGGTAWELA